jgi:hypothetical protein
VIKNFLIHYNLQFEIITEFPGEFNENNETLLWMFHGFRGLIIVLGAQVAKPMVRFVMDTKITVACCFV